MVLSTQSWLFPLFCTGYLARSHHPLWRNWQEEGKPKPKIEYVITSWWKAELGHSTTKQSMWTTTINPSFKNVLIQPIVERLCFVLAQKNSNIPWSNCNTVNWEQLEKALASDCIRRFHWHKESYWWEEAITDILCALQVQTEICKSVACC